ncbi:MAG: hypothetical protein ABIS47_05135 [Acidimicrobiales bacterium]
MAPAVGSVAGRLLHLQRVAGNRAVTGLLTAQRDPTDFMRTAIAARRGQARGTSEADADQELFATDRFASTAGLRATSEAATMQPIRPDVGALQSTLEMRSRVGGVATDAPGLGPAHDQAGGALRSAVAADRWASGRPGRSAVELGQVGPVGVDAGALESTLDMRSRLGAAPSDAPGLDPTEGRAGGALRSAVASDRWASGRRQRSGAELGQVGHVEVDRGHLGNLLDLNVNADVTSEKERAAEVKGRSMRNNRMALQARLTEVKLLALTPLQQKKVAQFEGHLNATVQGTLSFASEAEYLTTQLESVAAWSAFRPVLLEAKALKDTTSELTDDVLTFFDAPGQTARQVRLAMVAIASDAAARVKALSDNEHLDPAADQSLRTRLSQQQVLWDAVAAQVNRYRVPQICMTIGKEWVKDKKLFENVANKTAGSTHQNKAALLTALKTALKKQRQPPPATWLKAVGLTMIHDLYMRAGVPEVSGCKVHSSVYKSEVAKLGADSWPKLKDATDSIVLYVLPTNGVLGFHVTLEGFPKFSDGRNGSPHHYRGGTTRQGNWAKRPSSVPNDWADVSAKMGERVDGEIERVKAAVDLIKVAGGVPGWPY